MAQPLALSYKLTTEALIEEYAYTAGRLRAAGLVLLLAAFEPFRDRLFAAIKKECELSEALTAARAFVAARDAELDRVSDAVLGEVLSLSEDDLLYKHYAGDRSPSIFKKPVLGRQLEAMRPWIGSLGDPAAPPSLQAFAEPVAEVIKAADEALAMRDAAYEQRSRFRVVGERRGAVDDFNGLRRQLFDELKKQPGGEAYARQFFKPRERDRPAEGPAAIAAAGQEISALEAKLAEKRSELAALIAAEEELRRAEAEREAARVALAAEERAIDEAKKRAAALRAKAYRR
jgi:hypothetical protein